jgi:uncharacterized membrane protein HdeD (DUF308 family)
MSQVPNDVAQRMQAHFAAAVQQHSKWFLVEGIVLVILGLLAILLPAIATLAIDLLLGWLFIISGIVGLLMTFSTKQAPGFWWSLVSGIVAIIAGVLLLAWPRTGVVSLTLVLIAFFLVEGIVSIMYAIEHRRELTGRWGWMLASGIITLVLAVMIWTGLPSTAAWAIGLLAGIDLVFGGSALIGIALAAKKGAGTAAAGQTPPPPVSVPPAKA